MVVDVDRLDRLALHRRVPDLQCQVVPRQDIFAILGELDVGDGRDDFREERFLRRVLFLLEHCKVSARCKLIITGVSLTFCVLITQGRLSHIRKLDGTL